MESHRLASFQRQIAKIRAAHEAGVETSDAAEAGQAGVDYATDVQKRGFLKPSYFLILASYAIALTSLVLYVKQNWGNLYASAGGLATGVAVAAVSISGLYFFGSFEFERAHTEMVRAKTVFTSAPKPDDSSGASGGTVTVTAPTTFKEYTASRLKWPKIKVNANLGVFPDIKVTGWDAENPPAELDALKVSFHRIDSSKTSRMIQGAIDALEEMAFVTGPTVLTPGEKNEIVRKVMAEIMFRGMLSAPVPSTSGGSGPGGTGSGGTGEAEGSCSGARPDASAETGRALYESAIKYIKEESVSMDEYQKQDPSGGFVLCAQNHSGSAVGTDPSITKCIPSDEVTAPYAKVMHAWTWDETSPDYFPDISTSKWSDKFYLLDSRPSTPETFLQAAMNAAVFVAGDKDAFTDSADTLGSVLARWGADAVFVFKVSGRGKNYAALVREFDIDASPPSSWRDQYRDIRKGGSVLVDSQYLEIDRSVPPVLMQAPGRAWPIPPQTPYTVVDRAVEAMRRQGAVFDPTPFRESYFEEIRDLAEAAGVSLTGDNLEWFDVAFEISAAELANTEDPETGGDAIGDPRSRMVPDMAAFDAYLDGMSVEKFKFSIAWRVLQLGHYTSVRIHRNRSVEATRRYYAHMRKSCLMVMLTFGSALLFFPALRTVVPDDSRSAELQDAAPAAPAAPGKPGSLWSWFLGVRREVGIKRGTFGSFFALGVVVLATEVKKHYERNAHNLDVMASNTEDLQGAIDALRSVCVLILANNNRSALSATLRRMVLDGDCVGSASACPASGRKTGLGPFEVSEHESIHEQGGWLTAADLIWSGDASDLLDTDTGGRQMSSLSFGTRQLLLERTLAVLEGFQRCNEATRLGGTRFPLPDLIVNMALVCGSVYVLYILWVKADILGSADGAREIRSLNRKALMGDPASLNRLRGALAKYDLDLPFKAYENYTLATVSALAIFSAVVVGRSGDTYRADLEMLDGLNCV